MVLSSSAFLPWKAPTCWRISHSSSSVWQHKQGIKNGMSPPQNEKPLNSSHLLWIYCLLLLKTNICCVSGSESIASLSAISYSSSSDITSVTALRDFSSREKQPEEGRKEKEDNLCRMDGSGFTFGRMADKEMDGGDLRRDYAKWARRKDFLSPFSFRDCWNKVRVFFFCKPINTEW